MGNGRRSGGASRRGRVEAARGLAQTVVERAPQGIVFVDATTGEVFANPEAQRLLGQLPTVEGGALRYPGRFCRPDGSTLKPEELPVSQALRDRTVRNRELVVERPDGTRLPVLASAAPVRDAAGRVLGAVAVFQDISTLREPARADWTLVVTHDMNQPMTTIIGYAQRLLMLLDRADAPPEARKAAQRILASARHLSYLIGDLVHLSTTRAGRLRLERRPVDLGALVRDAAEQLAEAAPDRPVRVVVAEGLPPVWGDAERIEQVLQNLLSNAVKYGLPGSEIVVTAERQGEHVAVAVTNVGPGIPPDGLRLIFDPFQRAPEALAGRTRGLGLGLYISRQLVEAHGGSIAAESVPGQTTTFRFTLPVQPPEGEAS